MPFRADETLMLRAGHGLILAVIALLVFGVVMVTSAGLSVNAKHGVDLHDVLLGRTTLLAGLSVLSMIAGACVPVDWFARGGRTLATSPVFWIVSVSVMLLILVHVPHIGKEVNGARRWIELGPIGFQPSEIAKWGLILALALYASRRPTSMDSLVFGFIPPMLLVLFTCALIAKEDLGTAVLICAVSVGILLAAGARLWQAALLMPIGALGFVVAIVVSPYRVNRIRAFLDPYADPQGIGYHILQSMGAIHGGGLAGRGLGNSIQKFGYLPEDTTDFIFAIICEELGVVGAALVICLYAFLLLCGYSIVRQVRDPFKKLVGLGVLLAVGLQAFINIAVVTGSAPTKGIALPLLSNGGTGWVLTAFCIGLLISMDRELSRKAPALPVADELALEPMAA